MDTGESDDQTDDDDVPAYRERAAAEIDQIAGRTKQTLIDAGIDLDVFFLIPSSGNSIAVFGTMGDPPDDLWDRVSDAVVSVLRDTTGLKRARCRQVVCASTDSIADQQRSLKVSETESMSGQ
jgi:hypothetical protein